MHPGLSGTSKMELWPETRAKRADPGRIYLVCLALLEVFVGASQGEGIGHKKKRIPPERNTNAYVACGMPLLPLY